MGLSSGGKTKTTSNETAVTQPQIPEAAQQPLADFWRDVAGYGNQDPTKFVTPMNSTQASAIGKAGQLYQGNSLFGTAADATMQTMNSQVAPAQTYFIDPKSVGTASGGTAKASLAGPAAQAQAAKLGPAQSVTLGGYDVGALGPAQGYDVSLAGPINLGSTANKATAQSLLTNFGDYLNPTTQALVDTNLSSFDTNAAELRAQQARQAAKTGAFGGSANAILASQTERGLAQQRGLLEAGLRSNAWNTALGASQYDTTNRQNVDLTNTAAQNQREEYLAGLTAQTDQFNAGARNSQASQLAGANNQFGLARFGAENDAARFGAEAGNQGLLFNATAANDFAKTNAGFQQETGLFNVGQRNDTDRLNANLGTNVSIANANNDTQASVANSNLQGSAILANAGAANDMSQFNSNLGLQTRGQNLAGAGQLANIAGAGSQNFRDDINAELALGNLAYGIQDAYTQAPLTQLQNYGSLLNPGGILNATTGQIINTTGTSTSKKSGGLLQQLIGAGAQLGSAAILASDRRVKRDIALIEREADGLGVYRYNYVWDDADELPRFGVMADEVEAIRPWALGPVIEGIQTVNYGEL